MELSSIDLKHIVGRLNEILTGYYVSNVYQIDDDTVLLKLHHSEKAEKSLVVSAGKGLWLTKYSVKPRESLGIASALRKRLARARLVGIEQPEGERIVILDMNVSEGSLKLIGEFFGEGNIVLTDGNGLILSALKKLRVRHREISMGNKYTLPPLRGLNIGSLSIEDMLPLLDLNLEASKWLGRNLALSKKYIEEILARAEVDPKTKGTSLKKENVERIYMKTKEVVSLAEAQDVMPMLILEDGHLVDATPFEFLSYQGKESRVCLSYLDALDDIFTGMMAKSKHEVSLRPLRQKIREIDFTLDEQQRSKEGILTRAGAIRSAALRLSEEVFAHGVEYIEDVVDRVSDFGFDDLALKNDKWVATIGGLTLEMDKDCMIMKLVSKLYDEAKSLERGARAIEVAERSLKENRNAMIERLREQESKTESERRELKREKAWFERYRWFLTSEGLLAIGGRDATSNVKIIKRHMGDQDLVFHADLTGSPFFVLKDVRPEMERSIKETAQAVASYSRAWREGFASIDAYWVEPKQVKTQAPSGMYLPKGSFLIEGRKNYIKGLEVKIAIGLHQVRGKIVVMGGPQSAVKKNSLAYVVIEPDRVSIGETAKKVKFELIKATGKEVPSLKDLPLDDIARALPPSGGRIVSVDSGEQSIIKTGTS
ncbi:MAG: ribosome rescue protein RqcH [Nitrososphaerales archaeon]